ncbi:hypothetical protein EV360DRAFT_35808 [Lentinula raphanica]|nr:hypothetical protein EV360DRAFT_35808 [Lentinula raphanica]
MSTTTSSSSTSASAVRRLKQVYVEIPPSPLHTSRRSSVPSLPSHLSFNNVINHHKENTPLQAHVNEHAAGLPQKRKNDSSHWQATAKKSRKEDTMPQVHQDKDGDPVICCHHCRNKRSPSEIVQCTFLKPISSKNADGRRCTTVYCRKCLKNKYNEDSVQKVAASRGRKETGHIEAAYIFKCPKCCGHCGCWKCKHKDALKANEVSSQANHLPGRVNATSKDHGTTAAAKAKVHKPKTVPKVTWSPIPTRLKLEDAEDRIFIREFILRFSGVQGMTMTLTQQEELESIGSSHDPLDDDDEESTPVNWVSEACVKNIILSLIGALAAEEDSSATLVMENAIRDIRDAGANLTKIWAVLSSLRESLGRPDDSGRGRTAKGNGRGDDESSEDRIILEYPDPLAAPVNHNIRSTRSLATSGGFLVVTSSQMVPVIVGLIKTVMESHAIRVAIDEGIKEGREKNRESRELVRLENESWKSFEEKHKSDPSKIATERGIHKAKVQDIENASKVVSSAFLSRSGPFGSDQDGRIYWALTPGVHDRKYASDYIVSRLPNPPKPKKARNRKQRQRREEADAQELGEWSWFLAVWGKNPNENSDDDEPQWWGFWDPKEIRNLANWLTSKNDLQNGDGGGGSTREMKALVKEITDYANVLEWRMLGEDY